MKKKCLITALLLIGSIGLAEDTESKLKDKPNPALKTIFVDQATLNSVQFLKGGMLYPEVRAQLIKRGWKPFNYGTTTQKDALFACLKRMVTAACELPIAKESDISYCFDMVITCNLFPELEAFSYTGANSANFIFENKHKDTFIVSTQGPFFTEKDRVENDEEFVVKGWKFINWNELDQIHEYVNVQLKGK